MSHADRWSFGATVSVVPLALALAGGAFACGGSSSGTAQDPATTVDAGHDGGDPTSGAGGSGSGGVPMSGGRNATAGAGGTPPGAGGTGAVTGTGGAGGTCYDCYPGEGLAWGMNGGLIAWIETSHLNPCQTYRHVRSPVLTDPPDMECSNTVPGCPAVIFPQLAAALADPVVVEALAAHALFGTDPRAVDGQVFRFTIGSDFVEIGGDCPDPPGQCRPIPATVQHVVDLLRALDESQLAKSPCDTVFAGP